MPWHRLRLGDVDAQIDEFRSCFSSGGDLLVLATGHAPSLLKFVGAAFRCGQSLAIVPETNQPLGFLDGDIVAETGRWKLISPFVKPTLPTTAGFALRSSGSTGPQRWVFRSWKSLKSEGRRYLDYYDRDAMSFATGLPLHHAFPLGFVGGAFLNNANVTVAERFNPRRVVERLRSGLDSLHALTPETARLVALADGDQQGENPGCSKILIGAGPITHAIFQKVAGLGVTIAKGYGSTETGALIGTPGEKTHVPSTGWPLPGAVLTLDSNGLLWSLSTVGLVGCLTETGIDSSMISPDGAYCLGDVASIDPDGCFTLHGRMDDAIKINDQFVRPSAVEAALAEVDGVEEAVVVASELDSGHRQLVAHIQTCLSPARLEPELVSHCRVHLVGVSVPATYRFYRVLPRTSTGKPDRVKLKEDRPPRPADLDNLVETRRSAAHLALLAATPDGLPSEVRGVLTRLSGETSPVSPWERWWAREAAGAAHLIERLSGRAAPATPSPDAAVAYSKAMSHIAQRLAGRLELPRNARRWLEVCYPSGGHIEELQRRGLALDGSRLMRLDEEVTWRQGAVPYTGLVLHNVVRRASLHDFADLLRGLVNRLEDGAPVVICDIFETRNSEAGLIDALTLEWLEAGLLPIRSVSEAAEYLGLRGTNLELNAKAGLFTAYLGAKGD